MKHYELSAELRTDVGKKASKKIRNAEGIPCVLYGGEKNINFTVSQKTIRKFIYTPEVMFADIKIGDELHTAITKEIQFDPVSDAVIHLDFYEVNPAKPIKIQIPLKLTGSSEGVKAGGKLRQAVRKIAVKGLMENLPEFYEIDVTPMKIGDSVRVRDLQSDKLEFMDPKPNILVTVSSSRAVADEADTEEAKPEETSAEPAKE